MQLTRLTLLSDYKNIKSGHTLEFSSRSYTSLVGANGSGKSNWIEAVAAVMLHLLEERIPDFDYSFYLEDTKEIRWQSGLLTYKDNGTTVDESSIDLPQKLIVSYSGEDHRLWDGIMKSSYSKYFHENEMNEVEEPNAIYINRYHWAIAFIVLMCSKKQEVAVFVKEIWGQDINLNEIQVKVKIDTKANGYKASDTQKLLSQIVSEEELYMSHIASFDIDVNRDDNDAFCKRLYYLLYALSMPVPNGKEINLQKAITSIEIVASNGLSLEGLSEGYKKRILMMLMTRIIGDGHTLYLLDEPDAHVDVAAKSKILRMIESAPGHVLMTTHSPLITHNMNHDVVRTVKNGDTNSEEWKTVIEHLSDNQFASVDNFLFTLKRKVVITEGKYDVYYIRAAVNKLKEEHSELGKLDDVALFSIGGTGDTGYFLDYSLEPVIGYLEKVVILFDKDGAGNGGYNETVAFVNKKGYDAKVKVFKYARGYPDTENDKDFYVEDYFNPDCYLNKQINKNNIVPFNLNGQPPYYEMKKMAQQSSTIKTFLENNYKNIDAAHYIGFLPLLREIITKLGL